VPAVMLSWRPADEDWSFNLLPTSPSTGLMFHGGSPTVPHDNFQCPMGICELCWIMPPGFEFLASLIAVDHVNKRDSSVVPGLSSNLQGIFIRPHMKPENASLLQRHSRECRYVRIPAMNPCCLLFLLRNNVQRHTCACKFALGL
jgi:hypothetical protein